jgi:murein DD-endopeptidase MepM/ murein hydrolase activator NlpD
LSAIALALVAIGLAGCSADVARFGNSAAYVNEASGTLSPASSTRLASAPAAVPLTRPKADLAAKGRSIEVRPHNAAVHVGAPKHGPTEIHRHRKQTVALARSKNKPRFKEADRRARDLTARSSPARRAQEPAERRSADRRASDGRPIFDWPVHGKVIARFGRQSDGDRNDGIAFAVPEGTPIKSADDGVVIYAGDGLKKFGNLVLVRHVNDYVTAYAHAKELQVKRGDQIKRGDVIGASGQTGSVSTPQLYFEVRRNSVPLDPLPLLKGRSEQHAGKRTATPDTSL